MDETEYPGEKWNVVSAAGAGWNVDLLAEAKAAAREFGSIASVAVHRGSVVTSSGLASKKVVIRSVRKSLLSALIGIEVKRGRVRLESTLAELGIDDVAPSLSDAEKRAMVGDLIKARSGIYHPALAESEEMKAERPVGGSHPRDSYWYYNNWDFNALGTIYERATGRSVFDGFHADIAVPLGMQDFHPDDGFYLRGPESEHPAYHFRMTARDLARFGFLYLRNGSWRGAEIVPRAWIEDSIKAYSITPDGSGYGYMWWTTGRDGEAQSDTTALRNADLPRVRYFAHGGFGQMIGVLPAADLVVVNLAVSRSRSAAEQNRLGDFIRLVARAAPK
jgi:CubicO group peptidase (beta-lactamase class C family)